MSGLPWLLFFFSISPTSESCFIALLIVRSLRPSFSTSCFRLYVIYKRPVSFSIQLFLFLQKQCRDLVKAEVFSLCIVKIVQSHLFFSSLFFSNVKGNILERDPPYMKVYAAHKKCANSACAFAATAWSSPSGRQNVCNTNLLYGLSFFVYAVL